MNRPYLFLLLCLLAAAPVLRADGPVPLAETTVGMTGRLEGVVLPGPELEAKPLADPKAVVVLRVVRVFPHGSAFRYDLEFSALEPGTHDLRNSLRRKDGSPAEGLPPLVVKANSVLPPGQVKPNPLEVEAGPRVGGYRTLLIVLGAAWGVGLLAIVASFFFPRRKRDTEAIDKPLSLADRLRPLVEKATAGQLSRPELAALERGLLAYWRRRLGLEAADPGEAVETLRKHPEAGPLLAELEKWLHRPGPPEPVDVAKLLAPYRDIPAEAIEPEDRGQRTEDREATPGLRS